MYYSRYPTNWKEISLAIRRDRATWCCEWCGVRGGVVGARDRDGKWFSSEEINHCFHEDAGPICFTVWPPKPILIVLTVAHLGVPYPDGTPGDKHDKSDCRPENLAALCQRCHLNFDRPDHLARAKKTRERKRQERGGVQLELLGGARG